MTSILGLQPMLARNPDEVEYPVPEPPSLVVNLEPWGATFRRNLADVVLFRRPPAFATSSPPAAFWPDVFVTQRPPWGAFAESLLYHGIVFALAWGFFSLLPQPRPIKQVRRFDPADVIYYTPSEYLPPLDTGVSHAARAQTGDPVLAKQPILSVPPEADNRRQTIVTPPDVKLNQDVDIPNIVAWGDHTVPVPGAAIERKSAIPALHSQIVAPAPSMGKNVRVVSSLAIDVVAPAPDATSASARDLRGFESVVVEPPPAINAASVRKLGDVNIGRSDVVAPAPQLAVEAQRTLPSMGAAGKSVVPPPPSLQGNGAGTRSARMGRAGTGAGSGVGDVVPPPPSVEGPRNAEAGGRLIVLGIHPSVAPPAEPPRGNRRGTFAAGPEGKPGARGTPEVRANRADGNGMGSDSASRAGAGGGAGVANVNGAPSGLHVGAANTPGGGPPGTNSVAAGTELASAAGPHAPSPSPDPRARAELVENPSQLERQIFRDRRLYAMTQNMPNLNSAGGSWVIRFAELDTTGQQGDISAPVADHKVDPAYPLQLMRENVAGTVTLRAIIRADGTVSDISVVNGADPRLDRYASQAFARWHFLPATKNSASVAVEAIVIIPFKPILRRSSF